MAELGHICLVMFLYNYKFMSCMIQQILPTSQQINSAFQLMTLNCLLHSHCDLLSHKTQMFNGDQFNTATRDVLCFFNVLFRISQHSEDHLCNKSKTGTLTFLTNESLICQKKQNSIFITWAPALLFIHF